MKKILFALTFFILLLSSCKGKENKTYTITFFNVGKADAILLQYDNKNMVIDTGTTDSASYFIEGLKKQNVKTIDYLIITHFDQDHVGGAKELLSNFTVNTVYQTYEVKTSKELAAYKIALANKNLTPKTITEETTFTLGDVTYLIYPPQSDTYDNSPSNNSSLVIKATYYNTSYLFAADAEKDRIKELNKKDIKADVLKVPHHGGIEDNSEKFFKNVSPKYAIITDSTTDPADDSTISLLNNLNTQIYYTKNGDITLTSDGDNISIKQ